MSMYHRIMNDTPYIQHQIDTALAGVIQPFLFLSADVHSHFISELEIILNHNILRLPSRRCPIYQTSDNATYASSASSLFFRIVLAIASPHSPKGVSVDCGYLSAPYQNSMPIRLVDLLSTSRRMPVILSLLGCSESLSVPTPQVWSIRALLNIIQV